MAKSLLCDPEKRIVEQLQKTGDEAKILTSVCQLPFCLNPEAKAKLLGIECQRTREYFLAQGLLQV